jgi:hypothetical protein
MKLYKIQTFEIENADEKQFHRIVILGNGTVVGLFSEDNTYFLQWFTTKETFLTKMDFVEFGLFETPALFHFENYVGIYSSKNDDVVIFHEDLKITPIKIPISNRLPKIKFPSFDKPLSNYHTAGNTDGNTIPFLFTDSSSLPIYVADLKIDREKSKAEWLNLRYWNNKKQVDLANETFERPQKRYAILDVLNKQNISYAYGIGDRDSGYLKPGMEFSELVTINETGAINETLFSLGRLYKENKKGGKECIFSSSGAYAILTPAFKSDDWKNKQKLFDLTNKQLIDIELPKGLLDHRIIDHNNKSFLLADNRKNLLYFNTQYLTICMLEQE